MKQTFRTISNENYRKLHKAVLSALGPLKQEYGLTFKIEGTTSIDHGGKTFKFALSGACPTEEGTAVDINKLEFDRNCFRYGLKPEHYMEKIFIRGQQFNISGIVSSRRKYPIQVKNVRTGTEYLYAVDMVHRALGITR